MARKIEINVSDERHAELRDSLREKIKEYEAKAQQHATAAAGFLAQYEAENTLTNGYTVRAQALRAEHEEGFGVVPDPIP